jgi:hypothetical protein
MIATACTVCIVEMLLPGRLNFDFEMLVLLMLAAALALGGTFTRIGWPWLFAPFAAALTVSLFASPTADAVMEYRRQLAVLAIAIVTVPLAALASADRGPAWRARLHGSWTSAGVLGAAAILTVAMLRWTSRQIATLPDALSLFVWQWSAGGRSVLSDHAWFGVGLAGPPPIAGLRVSTVAPGGAVFWFLAATGVVGLGCYTAIWVRALWISGSARGGHMMTACHGVLLAVFAVSQQHNLLAGPAYNAALLAAVGLAFGLIEATKYDSADRVEPNHS